MTNMSHARCICSLLWLAAALVLVPRTASLSSGLLSQLADKSICQSEVTYDINPDRIPRIIKQVKCAETPDKLCPARDGSGESSCCSQNSHEDYKFFCQEVLDYVVVSDDSGNTRTESVSVGCTCVMHKTNKAIEVD